MTISTTTNRVSYTGNGVTTAFAFSYYFLADADLVVIERVTATGVETTKTLTTHYTVAGAGDAAGGTVTMLTAPASTVELIIYRDPAITQGVDLVNNDPLPVETAVERPLDRLTMVCQRLADRIGRALRLTDGDTSGAATTIVPKASNVIGWNSAGTALENKTIASIGAVVLSDATPEAVAITAAAGTSADASRKDHVHALASTVITGQTALTAPAVGDELLVYDLSATANRKITLANHLKAVNALTAETSPATDDELLLYDLSATTADKITLADMLKVINALTADGSPDTAADYTVTYDASAGAAKKVLLSSIVPTAPTIQIFTANGTWTKPSGCRKVRVRVVGGGGGGAGGNGSVFAAGGGGGGYAEELIDVTAISSETVTVGAGATAVAANTVGNNGNTSSFGAHCSATGGSGGSITADGGDGGIGSGGDINAAGGAGTAPQGGTNKGKGGNSMLGGGPKGGTGRAYGSGGAGGDGGGGTAGGDGVVIVEEFY